MTKIVLLLPVCLLLAGCRQSKGGPDRYVDREIAASELVGGWEISSDTIQDISKRYGADSVYAESQHLTLHEDGSCVIKMFPGMHLNIPDLIDGTCVCTWKLSKASTYIGHQQKKVQAVEILAERKDIKDTVSAATSYTIRLFIHEENGKLILWDFMGDPDYNEYRDFVKLPE